MRLYGESALVVCLCLWIPVAQSYGALAPEDQDGSGDDEEFSGSGSGSGDGNWFFDPEVTTQASPNETKNVWFTDAPTILPEHPSTQFNPDTESETSGHITEAPLSSTTQVTETLPSLVIKSVGSEEDQKDETTTTGVAAQPETTVLPETTVPPDEELPVVPVHEEEYTTVAHDESVTESSVRDQEEAEATVFVKTVTVPSEAPNMETTTLLLSTSVASNLADAEASGGDVESTTVKAIEEKSIEPNIISGVNKPNFVERSNTPDFGNDNNLDSADQSGSRTGLVSNSNSLLEKKEVLAGVIAGGVVGLAFAVMLVALMVYRMKKKDEGSYSLDEHKHPNGGYQKPQKQEEFLA